MNKRIRKKQRYKLALRELADLTAIKLCICPYTHFEDDFLEWDEVGGYEKLPKYCSAHFITDYDGEVDAVCNGNPADCWYAWALEQVSPPEKVKRGERIKINLNEFKEDFKLLGLIPS